MDSITNTGFDYNMNGMMKAFALLAVVVMHQAALRSDRRRVLEENLDLGGSPATGKLLNLADDSNGQKNKGVLNQSSFSGEVQEVSSAGLEGKAVKMTSTPGKNEDDYSRKLPIEAAADKQLKQSQIDLSMNLSGAGTDNGKVEQDLNSSTRSDTTGSEEKDSRTSTTSSE